MLFFCLFRCCCGGVLFLFSCFLVSPGTHAHRVVGPNAIQCGKRGRKRRCFANAGFGDFLGFGVDHWDVADEKNTTKKKGSGWKRIFVDAFFGSTLI